MDGCTAINFAKHVNFFWSKLTLFALHDGFCGSFHNKANSKLGQRQFWHALQKLLLSHPWPNMNDQCTIWKKNKYAIIHSTIFGVSILRDLGLKLSFLFLNSLCITGILMHQISLYPVSSALWVSSVQYDKLGASDSKYVYQWWGKSCKNILVNLCM